MVCILASAVPLHSVLYAALLLLLVGWQVASARPGILKHLSTAAVLGGVVLTSAAALLDAPASRTTLSASTPIFVIADSLSAGMGASDEGTWPQLLSRRLNLEVHNLARPGATLADGKVQAGAIPITSRPLVARRAGWCALERHVGLDDNGIEADGLAQLHFS
jgi:hypothetical protein